MFDNDVTNGFSNDFQLLRKEFGKFKDWFERKQFFGVALKISGTKPTNNFNLWIVDC